MTLLQKISAITLAFSFVAYGWYFLSVIHLSAAGPLDMEGVRPLIIKLAILLVSFTVVAPVLLNIFIRKGDRTVEPPDERDWLIWMRTGSKSIHILYAGVIIALGLFVFGVRDVVIFHVLLGTLAATDIMRMTLMLADYRRGV